MKKQNRKYWIIGASLLLLIPLVAMSSGSSAMNKPIFSSRLRKSKYGNYTKWIEAMAKHESGNYTSRIAKEYNNIFGMGFPTRRAATNAGRSEYKIEGQYMSTYDNYDQAIADLLLWFDYNNFPTDLSSIDQFADKLREKGYYTASVAEYTKGLKRWV